MSRPAASLPPLLAAALFASAALPAQATAERLLVLLALPGTPATALVEVDPATGAVVALPGFPSDGLPPLAIAVDPATREPVVALADTGGSRLVRLHVQGRQVLGESPLAFLPGPVVGMTFPSIGDLLVAVGGPGGGIARVGRQDGALSLFWSTPGLTALSEPVILPGKVWAALELVPTQPAIAPLLDTSPGGPVTPPQPLAPAAGARATGVHEFLGHGGRTQLVCDTAGRFFEVQRLLFVQQVALNPPFAAGGAVAMRASADGARVLVLGGAADPHLRAFDLRSPQVVRPVTLVAGPFVGAPVDFARTGAAAAAVVRFGAPCAAPAGGRAEAVGLPQLGNAQFALRLAGGLPAAPALAVFGLSERSWAGVPLPLPLGTCRLLVSADAGVLHFTDAAGIALQPLPVPNSPALAGAIVHQQWLQDPVAPRASDALAVQPY